MPSVNDTATNALSVNKVNTNYQVNAKEEQLKTKIKEKNSQLQKSQKGRKALLQKLEMVENKVEDAAPSVSVAT